MPLHAANGIYAMTHASSVDERGTSETRAYIQNVALLFTFGINASGGWTIGRHIRLSDATGGIGGPSYKKCAAARLEDAEANSPTKASLRLPCLSCSAAFPRISFSLRPRQLQYNRSEWPYRSEKISDQRPSAGTVHAQRERIFRSSNAKPGLKVNGQP